MGPAVLHLARTAIVQGRRRRAFSLIEILIVTVILAILAMVIVPRVSDASHEAAENSLKDDLRYLRTQIGVYKAQHRDLAPGITGNFLNQMTLYTDEAGTTSPTKTPTHKFGRYLMRMPANPLNHKDTIKISNAADLTAEVDDTTGWVYNPATQQIIANTSGADNNGSGIAYSQY